MPVHTAGILPVRFWHTGRTPRPRPAAGPLNRRSCTKNENEELDDGSGRVGLGLAAFVTPGKAQGPTSDTVYVNLPSSITMGDKTLQPGDSVIQGGPALNPAPECGSVGS
jgi:hypothetical protein